MARKKSVSGRSKGVDAVNRLFIQAERINKKLRALEKAEMYGIYASKKLIIEVSQTKGVEIVKTKSGRHFVRVSKGLTTQQQRAIQSTFKSFLGSNVSTPTQILRIRKNTREKITQTLSEKIGREASDEDIDKFFEVISYQQEARQDSIFNYISPSEFYILADEGVSRGLSDERFWTDLIVPHVPQEVVNNQYIRDECKYLYQKYFREVR